MFLSDLFPGFVRAMRHPQYRNYTLGSMTSLVGTWTHRMATAWLIWELTQSYAWLGIIAFGDLFLIMIFSPFAGAVADRMDRLKLSAWSQVGMMLQAIAVAGLTYADLIDKWILLGLVVYLGIMHAFHTAGRLSLVPNLVPKEDLTPAIAINSMIYNVGRFIGPAAAGLIILYFGVIAAFVFNAITFIVFFIVLVRIKMVRLEHDPAGSKGSMLSDIREGFCYTVNHRGIGPILVLLALSSMAGKSLPDLLPGVADGIFKRGPEGLAWLTSALGLGAMLSGFVYLARAGVIGVTRMVFNNLFLMGAFLFLFAINAYFPLAVLGMFLVGFTMNINSIGILNLIQNSVEGSIRGRVMSLFTLINQGAPALGALAVGWIAEYTGLRWPMAGSALLCILVCLIMLPRLRSLISFLEVVEDKAQPSSPEPLPESQIPRS
jgi:MFS family permease